MAKTTILFGFILIGLGLVGYLGTEPTAPAADDAAAAEGDAAEGTAEASSGKRPVTALIPAFVGILLTVCGGLALNEARLKHAMHGAAMVGLLGAIAGAGRGAMGLGKFFSGDPELNRRSFLFVWLMAIICAVFVALCVRSFIATRKRREAEAAAAQ